MNNDLSVEAKASALGWVPQEQFRGDPERWVDAETFVRRGEEVLPIIKKNNEHLQEQVARLKAELDASKESVSALKAFYDESLKTQVEAAKVKLLAEIREAREAGDVDREESLREDLTDLRAKEREVKAPAPTATAAPALDPVFVAWKNEPQNAWFEKDKRRTSLALGIAQELRENPENNGLVGRAFFDKVAAEVEKVFGAPASSVSKVEGSRNTGDSGGTPAPRGKGYASLPAEAKAACDRQGAKLVGKGRAFETNEAWRAEYARIYYQGE